MTAIIPKYIFRSETSVWNPGPEKEIPPNAWRLGDIPTDCMERILSDYHSYPHDRNDIGNKDLYPISGYTNLNGYRQILLQHHRGDGMNEMDYIADDPNISCLDAIRSTFPLLRFCRARFMVLSPGHEVPWHVDANTREYVRIHFMIQGQCRWLFRRNRNKHQMSMLPGSIWFTNTAWLHTIANEGHEDRIMLTVHAEYDSMIKQFGEPREDAIPL